MRGIFPIGMEQLPARDATGVAVSLQMVDQADIYIGVYAFQYRWIPGQDGVSVTEMEFDRAVASRISRNAGDAEQQNEPHPSKESGRPRPEFHPTHLQATRGGGTPTP
jgi:hypothetical protein